MALGNLFLGTPTSYQQVPRLAPQQISAQGSALQNALQMLQQRPNLDFAPIAQQARQQFSQQTVPSIAERFTSMGSGAQRSSAFQGALGSAGAGLESQLAAMGSQYGLQQQGQQNQLLQALLQLGLQPQFETVGTSARPGLFGQAGSALLGSAPILAATGAGLPLAGGLGALGLLLAALGNRQ